ncbi:hypothetical protein DFJ77DRAFT_548953 [Powellomyces hirtus]|nr:hypothetical protein DFJ77DRAFT_548953 [Powellomyces hirtus]
MYITEETSRKVPRTSFRHIYYSLFAFSQFIPNLQKQIDQRWTSHHYTLSDMPRDMDSDCPLWEQLQLRMSDDQLSIECARHEADRNKIRQTDKYRFKDNDDAWQNADPWSNDSSSHTLCTRKAFVRTLFTDDEEFRKFAGHIKNDPFTVNTLRFHSAYTDLMLDLADCLPSYYRDSLPRDKIPTYGIARFLSPLCPPTAPPVSIPHSLLPRFRSLWQKYLKDAERPTFLGGHLSHTDRVSLAVAMGGEKLWAGIMDECTSKLLELVYRGGFMSYATKQGSRRSRSLDKRMDEANAHAHRRTDRVDSIYPTPNSSPLPVRESHTSPSRPRYSRSSIYSDCRSPQSRPLSNVPSISARSSSLRPPPAWAVSSTAQRASLSVSPIPRVSFAKTPHSPGEEDPRDSGISVGSHRSRRR